MRAVMILPLLATLVGCAATEPAPEDGVRTWGTVKETLLEGWTQARVDVADVISPTLVGVGAAAGLEGEITIADGECYVARVRDGEIETRLSSDVKATMLFAANVAEWQTIQIAEAVPSGELEDLVVDKAKAAGVDTSRPFPFQIEGELAGLEAHVIAGQCPMQATMSSQPLTSPPVRRSFARVRGRLVGIWASDGGGVITHHGSRAHVHAIVGGDALFTGHCEAVAVEAGAVLRLPAP